MPSWRSLLTRHARSRPVWVAECLPNLQRLLVPRFGRGEITAEVRDAAELAVAHRHPRAVAELVLDRQRLRVPRLGGGEIATVLRHHAELVVALGHVWAVAERRRSPVPCGTHAS